MSQTPNPTLLLPPQPSAVSWPTERWPERALDDRSAQHAIETRIAEAFQQTDRFGETHALLLVQRGAIVAESYGKDLDLDSTRPSWSCAKSMLHAVVGMLVGDGRLDIHARAHVPEWQGDGDPRREITLDALLRMSSGLTFLEDYEDAGRSDCIEMLFGGGKDDTAGYAARLPLEHPVDSVFSYSSGTSNIVARMAGRAIGGAADGYARFLRERLFAPLGMRSAEPRFDASGTWIGSSFCFCTPRDFARFGTLYLRDGVWEGRRLLPEGWVDYARTPTPTRGALGEYGAHWWLSTDGSGVFSANGFKGQFTVVSPARDAVLVRSGDSTTDSRGALFNLFRDLFELLPAD